MKIIDKYLLKNFIATFVFSLLALYFIFLIVNLMENLDKFLDSKIETLLIVKYYIYFFPEILKLLTPIAMLLSSLFSIGKLSGNSEIIAMKSGGTSLSRIMLPILIFSIFVSAAHFYFNGWVVPKANEEKLLIERTYIKKNSYDNSIYNFYFRHAPNEVLYLNHYNPSTKTGTRVAFETFNNAISPRLISRIEASSMIWDTATSNWIFLNGSIWKYGDSLSISQFGRLEMQLKINHEQIIKLAKNLNEMTYVETITYIELMKQGGRNVKKLQTEFYSNYAYPFSNIIVILFAVPFASIKKRGGMALNIAAALVVVFTYLIITKLSQSIAVQTDLNPIISAWISNVVFLLAGIYNMHRMKN